MTSFEELDQIQPSYPPMVRDCNFTYGTPGSALPSATRRLRVFATGEHHVTAILTEARDSRGVSITRAAGSIRRQLDEEYPDKEVRIIERHKIHDGHIPGERFFECFQHAGLPAHRPIGLLVIYAEFGDGLVD